MGIKAEVEKSEDGQRQWAEGGEEGGAVRTDGGWVEISVEIPGYRDDDGLGVFLGSVLREALVATSGWGGGGGLLERLVISRGWHWKLWVDVSMVFILVSILTVGYACTYGFSRPHLASLPARPFFTRKSCFYSSLSFLLLLYHPHTPN